MVAIRITKPDQRADGFMLLVEHGTVRTLAGEIYVCKETSLAVLDIHNISYEKVPVPVDLDFNHPY